MASAGRVAGLKIELTIDGSKTTKYLSAAQKETERLQKSLKDLERSLKLNPRSTELLKQKFELLGKSVQETKQYLIDLKNAYQRLAEKQNLSKKDEEAMRNLAREISDTEVKLKSLTRQYELFNVTAEKVKSAGASMQAFGDKLSGIGNSVSSLGMQISRISAPIAAAFTYGMKETMSFEQSMANVQAVTQATQEDFQRLESAAIDMSKTTVYSADETAEALYYMGLAGWDATESIAALPGVLDLAAAGQVDLGRSASIVVDTMNALQMDVEGYTNGIANAEHFTNVMAAAMSNSNTTVDLLGESFKYAAPMAGTLGYSVDDLTFALGLMASSGIKGSQAGTGLRMALKNMADETKIAAANAAGFAVTMEDGYGKALPLRDVMVQLRDQFGGLNLELLDAEGNLKDGETLWAEYGDSLPATQMDKFRTIAELVGVRALPGILGMINASQEDFDQLANAIDNADGSFVRMGDSIYPLTEAIELFGQSAVDAEGEVVGVAEAMREIQLSTAQGQITLLKDNFAALAIELGKEVIPYIIDFAQWLSGLVDKFRALSPETKRTILIIAGIVAALGPLLLIIGQILIGLGGLITFIGSIVAAAGTVISVISAVVGAVGALPVVIGALVVGLLAFIITHWEEFKTAMVEIWNSIKELAIGLWEGLKVMFADVWNSIKELFISVWTAIKDFFISAGTALSAKATEIFTALRDFFIAWLSAVRDHIIGAWTIIRDTVVNLVTAIKDRLVAIWENIKASVSATVSSLREFLSTTWNNIKNSVTNSVSALRTTVTNIWNSIKSTATSVWNGIKNAMLQPIESAKQKIESIINRIKSFFPISLGNIFSNFKLPHINVTTGKFGIPSFSVDWYAKAMDNGILLDGATIFGMNAKGQPMGGGEVGREWIIGENGLQSMIRNEVSRNQLSPEVIYDAVVAGMEAANVSVYMDADKVTKKITKTITAQQASRLRFNGA